jgi:hypothetical protein
LRPMKAQSSSVAPRDFRAGLGVTVLRQMNNRGAFSRGDVQRGYRDTRECPRYSSPPVRRFRPFHGLMPSYQHFAAYRSRSNQCLQMAFRENLSTHRAAMITHSPRALRILGVTRPSFRCSRRSPVGAAWPLGRRA